MNDFEIKEGVNYDYILALRLNDDKVVTHKIPVTRNLDLLDRLKRMYYDDCYDLSDIHRAIERNVHDIGPLPYCFNHKYGDRYISEIAFPQFDRTAYREKIRRLEESEMDRRLWQIERYRETDYDYYRKRKSEIKDQVREIVTARIRKDKKEHAESFVSYVYAYDYHNTVTENGVKEKYNMFSSDIHGHFTYSQDINEDLKVTVRTNFCYGSSSSFHLTVSYKGIDLLPYSTWVKYYYAGYNELIRNTRSYVPERGNWVNCFGFTEEFANKAISDPETFVKEDIMMEVSGLMEGLEQILHLTDSEMRGRLEVSHIDEDDGRYIGISCARHANAQDRVYYEVAPSECSMVYRMEKICGALHFLESLRKLKELYSEIQHAIDRILEMNEAIFPELGSFIDTLSQELAGLKENYDNMNRCAMNKQAIFDRLDRNLQARLDRTKDRDRRDAVRESYIKTHPQYETLRDELDELSTSVHKLGSVISNREKLISRLSGFKELIQKEASL